jgi:hypothetical protein
MMLGIAVSLYAQTVTVTTVEATDDNPRLANVMVWVAPAVGGTKEDRAYFDFNLPEEVIGGGYALTNGMYPTITEDRNASDFYITVTLGDYDEEYGEYSITLELYNTQTGQLIVTDGMGYDTTEMMNDWNLTMIYRVMANAPISKFANSADLKRLLAGGAMREFPKYWLYLGVRAGYSARFYKIPPQTGYINKNQSLGNTFEIALQATYQVKPFLALQGELLFTMDTASHQQYHTSPESTELVLQTDKFQSGTLMIPLILKGTFWFDRFLVEPLAGLYLTVPLSRMTTSAEGDSAYTSGKSGYTYSVPLGFTAGADFGVHLGPGTLFLDARYSADFGNAVKAGDTVYRRSMVSLSMGYRFGFFKKKTKEEQTAAKNKAETEPPRSGK